MQEVSEQASYAHGAVLTPVKADALDLEERACCICFQPFGSTSLNQHGPEEPIQLPCGHVFGEVCISTWTLSHNSCPLCRNKVLCIDDCPANRQIPDSSSSDTLSLGPTARDDVWLDEEVWNNSSESLEDVVSNADIETLINFYTRDLSNVSFDSQHRVFLGRLLCGKHRGLCHCCDDQNIRNAALPHRRLTPPGTARTRQTNIDSFDLAELGSQFAELDYRYRSWMDEYLNEPTFHETSMFGNAVENIQQLIRA